MKAEDLKPNNILRGPIFPEPVQIIIGLPMSGAVKLVGNGVNTSKEYEPVLTADQLLTLETTPDTEPFDGDPLRFRRRLRKDYWLYVVFHYASPVPSLNKLNDLATLEWQPIVKVEHYRLRQDSVKHPVKLKEDTTPYRTGGEA